MSRATTVGQCETDGNLAEVLGVWKVVGMWGWRGERCGVGGGKEEGRETEKKTVISRSPFRDVCKS